MGSYKGDLTETKLLQQSRRYEQPKENLIPFAVAMTNNFCSQHVKLMQPHGDKDSPRELASGKESWKDQDPGEEHFHSLLDLSEMNSDTKQRSARRYAELEETVGGKKGGSRFFLIHSKICPASPPPSQITVRHLENKGS